MKPGVRSAVTAAVLFGASVPLAKFLLAGLPPLTLAGLLYLGSGLGLAVWRQLRPAAAAGAQEASLARSDLPWLAAAILCGGILAPVLLLSGLRATPAATGSLLLNLEGVFTALLAWFAFREHFDRRIALGMAVIVAGGVLLSWPGGGGATFSWGTLAIAGACLSWGADNNFTRKVAAADPAQIAMWKGLAAGVVNLTLGLATERPHFSPAWVAAGGLGFLSYGVSLVCFVLALRQLGAARTGAYFATAPFVGAALSGVFLGERPVALFWPAAALMALGVWLHLSEHHEHAHVHGAMAHAHRHTHDDGHHQHAHDADAPAGEPHSHWHRHEPLTHAHPHTPDLHHQHGHQHRHTT